MKLTTARLVLAAFAGMLFFACSPKVPAFLEERQELHYSRSWKKMNNYSMTYDLFC